MQKLYEIMIEILEYEFVRKFFMIEEVSTVVQILLSTHLTSKWISERHTGDHGPDKLGSIHYNCISGTYNVWISLDTWAQRTVQNEFNKKKGKYSIRRSGITTCIISTTNYVPVFINNCSSMATPRSYICTLSVRLRPLQLLKTKMFYTRFSWVLKS
jgi:hypothetical protein